MVTNRNTQRKVPLVDKATGEMKQVPEKIDRETIAIKGESAGEIGRDSIRRETGRRGPSRFRKRRAA